MRTQPTAVVMAMALGAGTLAAARPVRACSPKQYGWAAIAQIAPASGSTDVALDAPLVFEITDYPGFELAGDKQDISAARARGELGLKVKVVDEATGQELSGTLHGGNADSQRTVWRPSQAMPAGARLKVTARVANAYLRPTNVAGADKALEEATLTLTTGAALLASVTSASDLALTLERYIAPVLDPCNCGWVCESPTATEPAVRARFTLPAVSGGFEPTGYEVRTVITRDQPYDLVADPGYGPTVLTTDWARRVRAGQTTEVVLRLPGEDPQNRATTICIASKVTDDSGKALVLPPVCQPAVHAAAPEAPPTIAPTAPPLSQSSSGAGCNVVNDNDPAAPLVLVAAFSGWAAFLILRRARRQRLF